jgi:hypothetical protein
LLAIVLLADGPLFLCQPLTADAVLYDLQARCVVDGGALYRDILEPNLPGAAWLHLLVRSIGGWSSVALRLADILIFSITVMFLCLWVEKCRPERKRIVFPGLSLLLFVMYLSLPECCHCQRDLWMLCPALGALHLRFRRVRDEWQSGDDVELPRTGTGRLFFSSLIEGLLWGTAFWIKPHIAIPAICVLGLSLWLMGIGRRSLIDLAGVLCGGILIGVAGSVALMEMGSWPAFWDMQLHWNPQYVKAGREKFSLSRLKIFWDGLAPWSYLIVAGMGVSLITAWKAFRTGVTSQSVGPEGPGNLARWLACLFFSGWLLQALVLQHPLAYVYVPLMVLGGTLCCLWPIPRYLRPVSWCLAVCFLLQGIAGSPLLQASRLSEWWNCVTQGPTLAVRSRVQVESQPDWERLKPVVDFLKEQDLRPGELTAYSGGLVHLYAEMGLPPSTRYVYVNVLAILFPDRVKEIHRALEDSPQRFVVSSLREAGMPAESIAEEDHPSTGLPVSFPPERLKEFPFTQPVVFRSGEYVVHRVAAPIGPLCTKSGPLAETHSQSHVRDPRYRNSAAIANRGIPSVSTAHSSPAGVSSSASRESPAP